MTWIPRTTSVLIIFLTSVLVLIADRAVAADFSSPALQLIGKGTEYNGPNCFGLVALHLGISRTFRMVSDEELVCHLTLSCRLMAENEATAPGDVGIIEALSDISPHPDIVHGFIFVSDELTLSKNGKSQIVEVRLIPKQELLRDYGVIRSKRCESPEYLTKCGATLKRYRCGAIEPIMEKSIVDFESRLSDNDKPMVRAHDWQEVKAAPEKVAPLMGQLEELRRIFPRDKDALQKDRCLPLALDSYESGLHQMQQTRHDEVAEAIRLMEEFLHPKANLPCKTDLAPSSQPIRLY